MRNLVNDLKERIRWPWSGTGDARRALEESEGEQERVGELADELRRIQRENHITSRIHAAFRGDDK